MPLLEVGLRRIAEGHAASKTFSECCPQGRGTRCEHHYVFALHPDGREPRILAVLHAHMDLLARRGDRLST
jgi:toxin ParE1/3/4